MPLIHKSSALISATGCTVVSFRLSYYLLNVFLYEQLLVCDFDFVFYCLECHEVC